MNDFARDIWNDLREKRLWPIAVAMLIGIVAIPAVLAKSSETPAAVDAPPPVADSGSAQTTLALDSETAAASGTGSSLDVFAPDDPFKPPAGTAGAEGGAAESIELTAAGAGSVDVGIEGGGGGGDTIDETVDVELPAPRTETETKTSAYEYVADVSFWQSERRRRSIEGLRKLDMLPNESAPVLIFMGATGDGGNATFLVDSTLSTAGEGSCRPSPENCAFVDIGPGSEHVFTAEDGTTYRLRVEEIRRVKVKAGASASGAPKAHTSVGAEPAQRRFELPSLIDLVEVSTTKTTTTAIAPKPADSRKPEGGR